MLDKYTSNYGGHTTEDKNLMSRYSLSMENHRYLQNRF